MPTGGMEADKATAEDGWRVHDQPATASDRALACGEDGPQFRHGQVHGQMQAEHGVEGHSEAVGDFSRTALCGMLTYSAAVIHIFFRNTALPYGALALAGESFQGGAFGGLLMGQ